MTVPQALIREARRRQRRRWLAAGAAVLILAAGAAAVIAGSGAGSGQLPPGPRGARDPGAPRAAPAPAAALMTVSQTSLPQGTARSLAAGYQAIWVTGVGVTYQVDDVTGRIVRTIPTPGTSGTDGCRSGIAAGAGAVWVTHGCRGIYRIDPASGRVTASLQVRDVGYGIAVASGVVWVTSWNGELMRIQPRTGRIIGKPVWVGPDSNEITVGAGTLWISGRWLSRVDLSADAPAALGYGSDSEVAAAGAGSLWAVSWQHADQVLRVDPATGKVTASVAVPGALAVAFWKGAAWAVALRRSLAVLRIDPATSQVAGAPAPVGEPVAAPAYSPQVTAGPTGLWLLDPSRNLLYHLVRTTVSRVHHRSGTELSAKTSRAAFDEQRRFQRSRPGQAAVGPPDPA